MYIRISWVLAAILCLFSFDALAKPSIDSIDITGKYQCTGHDPYTPRNFDSTITITKTNDDLYSITEGTSDDKSDVGVAILTDNILSLAYQDRTKLTKVGVQAMTVLEAGKKLSGPWAQLGKGTTGSEVCNKIN